MCACVLLLGTYDRSAISGFPASVQNKSQCSGVDPKFFSKTGIFWDEAVLEARAASASVSSP